MVHHLIIPRHPQFVSHTEYRLYHGDLPVLSLSFYHNDYLGVSLLRSQSGIWFEPNLDHRVDGVTSQL